MTKVRIENHTLPEIVTELNVTFREGALLLTNERNILVEAYGPNEWAKITVVED